MDKYIYEKDGTEYMVVPSYGALSEYTTNIYTEGNYCVLYMLLREYNFTEAEFFAYIISKFHAIVYLEKTFPYFTIRFKNITDVQNFCSELNRR